MFNKLGHSQSTIASGFKSFYVPLNDIKQGQTALQLTLSSKAPLKFPKNRIRKQGLSHILNQTIQNPQRSTVRCFSQANFSRFFQGNLHPLTQTQKLTRHKQYLFDSPRYISKKGQYSHLARQSIQYPIKTRTFEDLGVKNNQKRIFSKLHYKQDPIIVGQREYRHNSSLQKVWNQPRKHRDNGAQVIKVLEWNTKGSKRQPFKVNQRQKLKKTDSYKQIYLKSKNFKLN